VSGSSTSDPQRARDHARAMAGSRVEAMPTVPASAVAELPAGVSRDAMLWEETIGAGGYGTHELAPGARLRLIDLEGDACVSMLVFNARHPTERLNVADTIKVQWNGYLQQGRLLLSDMGRVLLSILTDDAETHDTFCGASNAAGNARKYGSGANWSPQPSARDRLLLGAAKHGLTSKDVHPCINWFKGVRIEPDGCTKLQPGPHARGRGVLLRAEMPVIVVLANCPHVLDPRPQYTVTPVRVTAWRGAGTAADDAIRNASPEARRAFENTDEYLHR
jgi:uncharacterized protein